MELWIIIDLIVVGIFILCVAGGFMFGFMKSVYRLLSLAVTIIAVIILLNPFSSYLQTTPIAATIENIVCEKVEGIVDQQVETTDTEEALNSVGLPKFLSQIVSNTINKDVEKGIISSLDISSQIAKYITSAFIKILAVLLLLVGVRLALFVVIHILDAVFSLPILNGVNKLAGGVIGAVNAMVIVYIACAVLMLLAPVMNLTNIMTAVDKSFITKCFYKHNLLMNVFMLDIFKK